MDTGSEVTPNYDEVVGSLRSKLEQAQFQNTVLEITVTKLRNQVEELESELGIDDEEG